MHRVNGKMTFCISFSLSFIIKKISYKCMPQMGEKQIQRKRDRGRKRGTRQRQRQIKGGRDRNTNETTE